eukprot:10794197-Heterocapsa_arctica.AAC.1
MKCDHRHGNFAEIRTAGMHQRDQQGDLRCGDTAHPVTMFCKAIASRSSSARSLHIVNATLCLIDDCPAPGFPKGITMEVAEFNALAA